MKILNLFAVTSNSDTTEGRGHTITHGYCGDVGIARAIVLDPRYSRYCCMGIQDKINDPKYMVRETSIIIFSSVDEFFTNTEDERKKRALAKLTPDERQLLGL